jgi:hypothetical protein
MQPELQRQGSTLMQWRQHAGCCAEVKCVQQVWGALPELILEGLRACALTC